LTIPAQGIIPVREVTVSGIEHLESFAVMNIAGLEAGRSITVPGDDITQAVQKLWDHGLFSDVKDHCHPH
jgi:outer membrane protein insertion porin family